MKISNDVANVLGNSRIDGSLLFLPEGQLDRKLYVSVNKALEAIGGKWNRGKKAHVFDECPDNVLENIIQTGVYTDAKTEYQFFETPELLAYDMVVMARIDVDETRLEPSAGKGSIARFMRMPDCVELNPDNAKHLKELGFNVVGDNFMKFNKRYDVIIANPPFTKQQDIDHINHMLDLANRCVISVASASVLFRTNKKTIEFRERIESLGGIIDPLPEGTFKESGTMVNTCLVCVEL